MEEWTEGAYIFRRESADKKKGFSISYYNPQQYYAIFDKNPKITIQDYVKDISQKDLDKYNSKGLYFKHLWNTQGVVQNGHDFVIQHYMEKIPEIIPEIINNLSGDIINYSKQKYSSNVIEKVLLILVF